MSVYQIESGSCYGRGFDANNDGTGWLAKFKDWVVKTPVSGGPDWNILLDRSPLPTAVTFTVNTLGASHLLDASSHGYYTGEIVQVSNSGGSLPNGLNPSQDYIVYKVNADQFRLCYTMTDAWNGTGTTLYNTGTGTHYAQMEGPYIVVSDQSSPTINQSAMIIKAGYKILEGTKIRTQYALSFDTTNKVLYGYWGGFELNSVDSGGFSYDFRGGAECMAMQSRVGSSWSTSMVDSWLGDSNFVEGTDKIGTLTSDATSGTNKVLQVGVGQAANFTPNRYYFITDMSGHAWVNYCKVTADDTVAHTITVDNIDKNFPTGSVIAAYAHRYYCAGNVLAPGVYRFNSNNYGTKSSIPYCSNQTSNKTFTDQNSPICGGVTGSVDTVTLAQAAPNDRGYFACQKPFIVEKMNQQAGQTDGMTEGYGIVKNMYVTNVGTMVQGLDGKTIGGTNWLYFQPFDQLIYYGAGSLAAMFPDSTSLV